MWMDLGRLFSSEIGTPEKWQAAAIVAAAYSEAGRSHLHSNWVHCNVALEQCPRPRKSAH